MIKHLRTLAHVSPTFRALAPRLCRAIRRLPAWSIVIVESPYAGDTSTNEEYARDCMGDCLHRGEAPYASHLLYTQPGALDDTDPRERALGIDAGFAFRHRADLTVVYTDLGMSGGMRDGIEHASKIGCEIVYRSLEQWREPRARKQDA